MTEFSMLGHWNNDTFTYELQIQDNDKIQMFPFKSPTLTKQKINTLASTKDITCPCKDMGDIEGLPRLYG